MREICRILNRKTRHIAFLGLAKGYDEYTFLCYNHYRPTFPILTRPSRSSCLALWGWQPVFCRYGYQKLCTTPCRKLLNRRSLGKRTTECLGACAKDKEQPLKEKKSQWIWCSVYNRLQQSSSCDRCKVLRDAVMIIFFSTKSCSQAHVLFGLRQKWRSPRCNCLIWHFHSSCLSLYLALTSPMLFCRRPDENVGSGKK